MKRFCGLIILILVFTAIGSTVLAAENPRVVLETNFGDIIIELYPDSAPITVNNFLTYVNDGFYNGTVFHRVMVDFMIQAGSRYTIGYTIYTKSPTYDPIANESNNGLSNVYGTISTALSNSADSATSQFFINQNDNTYLDYPNVNGYGHCVFGAVVEGMDVVDDIAVSDVAYVDTSLTHFPYNPPAYIHTAYELPCEQSYCSDLTSAGQIDFEDFAILASYWLDVCNSTNGFCGGADIDYSGGVDLADLNLFWNHWARAAGYECRFSDLAPVSDLTSESDLMPDYTINSVDLSVFAWRWLNSDCNPDNNYCDRADINRDGAINLVDYSLLSSHWLEMY